MKVLYSEFYIGSAVRQDRLKWFKNSLLFKGLILLPLAQSQASISPPLLWHSSNALLN